MKSKKDLNDLVELNFDNPKVAGLIEIIIKKTAKPEPNFRKEFLDKLIEDLGYILGSETHLTTGDIDYLYEVGNYVVGFEAKSPSIIEKQGAFIYKDELKRHLKQVHQYFGDPKLNYLILTDGINWYFYSRKSIRRDTPHYIDFRTTQLLHPKSTHRLEDLSKNKIIDTLQRLEYESDREGLDEKFYRSLKSWVEECRDYFIESNLSEEEAKSEAVALINKFIFVRSLEDFGTLPFNYLRKEVKEYIDRWGRKEGAKRLSRDINDWMFQHYDTELFVNHGAILSPELWEYLILGKLLPEPKSLFTPSLYDFNFSNINFDILGHVYERFLAELKREHGIYYTQRFVVEYIIDNAIREKITSILAKALKKLDENKLDDSKSIIENELFGLRILDPAPGSGSFLIYAFDILTVAYQKWEKNYINKYNKIHKDDALPITRTWASGHVINDWKEKIILNCLYGCDIDDKAVDVAKLNLWLRLIRYDPENYYWKKLQDSGISYALPNLSLNLINGNSLIGPQFKYTLNKLKKYQSEFNQIKKLRTEYIKNFKNNVKNIDEIEKLKSQIKKEFRDEIKQILSDEGLDSNWANLATVWFLEFPFGKFDFVIGNPPYIGEEDHKEIFRPVKASPLLSEYYEGKMDYWYFFCQLGISLLKDDGIISFIVPHYWPKSEGAAKLIKSVINETSIESIFDFNEYKVFKETAPGQHNMVFRFKKSGKKINPKITIVKNMELTTEEIIKALHGEKIEGATSYNADRQDKLLDANGKLHFTSKSIDSTCTAIKKIADGVLGGENGFCNVNQGIVPAIDVVGVKSLKRILRSRGNNEPTEEDILSLENELGIKRKEGVFVLPVSSLRYFKLNKYEKDLIRPYFWGHQIKRFHTDPKNLYFIIYTTSEKARNIKNNTQKYPNIKRHLDKYKPVITSDFGPYGLHRARDENIFISEKIVGLRQTKHPTFAYNKIPYYMAMVCNIITKKETFPDVSLKALTAILNSKLGHFWFYHRGKRKGELLQIDGTPLGNFPIKLPTKNISKKLELKVDDIENLKDTYYKLLNKWEAGVKIICGESAITLNDLFKWTGVIEKSKCKISIDPEGEIEDIDFMIKDSLLIVSTNIGDNIYNFKERLTALHVLYSLEFLFEVRMVRIGKFKSFLMLKIPYKSPGLFKEANIKDFYKELEDFATSKNLSADLSCIKNEIINKEDEINKNVADLYNISETDLIL